MNAVGRLGRYISRGVYTVSGPFHPFGGCVDIIVVQQQDGSFKSSSWYVRFGKFQGVLKTREKVVNICVNGVEADFHMYLDHKGEAYFLKEVDVVEEGESVLNYSSSGDEENDRPLKSQSCNFDVGDAKTLSRIDSSTGKIRRRTNSRRLQILGLVFGRRSVKESDNGGEKESDVIQRVDSLERAEFAAKLLEVKWSTNLDASKTRNDVLDGQDRRDMEIDGRISHVSSLEKNDEISTLSEIIPESECHVASNVTGHADELTTMSVAEHEENADGVFSEVVGAGLQDPMEVEVCTSKQYDEEEVSNGKEVQLELPRCGISQNGRTDSVQSFIYCESSERSIARNDASSEQTHETLYITSSGCGHLHVHAETLHARTEPLSEDTVVEQLLEDFQLEAPTVEGPNGCSEQTNSFCACTEPIVAPESYAQISHTNPMECLGEEVEPQSLCNISSLTNSFHQFEVEVNMKVQDSMCKSQPSSESERIEATNILPLVSLQEEQLLFGDIDEFKSSEIKGMESEFPLNVDIENYPSCSPEGSTGSENSTGNMRVASSPIGIIRSHKAVVKEVGRLAISLPNMRSQIDGFGAHNVHCLGHSLDSNCKLLNWTMQSKDNLSSTMSGGDKEHQLAAELPGIKDALVSGELKDIPSNPAIGEPSKASSPNGNWRLWPFSFRRSRSRKAVQPVLSDVRNTDAEDASEIKTGLIEAKNMLEGKVVKKLVRVLCPTSEQLASLNLKEGRNTVTFTFLTPMLGKQQVDARIYLWKWNTKIVISDVDGTITRSDVLGQFMPLVGVDWSHLGVAHLFSAIKENGYQLLFLSARAISQAYLTRQFLFNLKQDGKALPDGPVVISPNGLFPSLYREVIRRAPHEFKISCLEEIRSLFPPDFNPFYAGFGNRDTDEISYRKVGIPKGKIFIINPKGEVAVNRCLDTKSYKSLHALVNGMFPPATSFEQEDFNSWNFWKLPPPMIDV